MSSTAARRRTITRDPIVSARAGGEAARSTQWDGWSLLDRRLEPERRGVCTCVCVCEMESEIKEEGEAGL